MRRQVITRIARRITALQLPEIDICRRYLADRDDERTYLACDVGWHGGPFDCVSPVRLLGFSYAQHLAYSSSATGRRVITTTLRPHGRLIVR